MSLERTLVATLGFVLKAVSLAAEVRNGPRTLLASLGWDLPPGVDDIGLAALDLGRVGELLTEWGGLANDPAASEEDEAVALAELALAVGAAVDDLLHVHLEAPQEYLDRTGIEDEFLTRLSDLYLIQSAAAASRQSFDLAVLLGLFELRNEPADPAMFQVAHIRHVVRWDRLGTLFTDPSGLLRDVYGWGTPAFDATTLVNRLGAVLQPLTIGVRRRDLPPIPLARLHNIALPPALPSQTQLFLTLLAPAGPLTGDAGVTVFGLPPTTVGGADGGLGLAPYADGTADLRISLTSRLSAGLHAGGDLGTGFAVMLRPGVDPVLRTGMNEDVATSGSPGAQLGLDLTFAAPDATSRLTLLASDGVSIAAKSVAAAVSVTVDANGTDAVLKLTVLGARFSLTDTGLPFLDAVLPEGGLTADFDLDLSWSHRGGVRLDGRAELRTSRAVGIRLGPVTLDLIELGLAAESGGLALTAGIGATLRLGPVQVVVQGVGVRAAISASPGSLGAADLTVRPSPPNAVGISIDAGIASGGGFLLIDPDGHTYVGVLDLKLGAVAVKALGVLDTSSAAPPGWSLLLLLFAQFAEPVPIGFGFSLSGVGGIVGVNFGVGTDQLRAALGTGAFDDIVFPADPVGDAPRIISRLRTFFPATLGALVFGPAVEITWGGDLPLVTARLAVLAQISRATDASPARFDRLVAIGTIHATAPPGDLPVPPTIQLVADLLGSYDAQSGLLAIDAQLRDSVIAGVAVGGTVIVRVGLGSQPAFALSAGGFHPDFTDLPPLLPARIDRVSLTWSAGGGTSLSMQLQAYVAVTAATLQLGASFQLKAQVGPVSLEGQLGFDLLVNADRSFTAHVVGRVGIKYRGHTLAGVGLDMYFSRSAEHVWRVRGTATFEILWWDIDVDFDDSWGQAALLPGVTVALGVAVREALADPANWSPALPVGGEHLVSLAPAPPAPSGPAPVLAHPLGQLRISQQVAPLDLEVDHVDDAQVVGARRVSVASVRIGDVGGQPEPTREPFTRARYQQLDEAERLRSRSFEQMPSGVLIGAAAFTAPVGIGVGAGHETKLIGPVDAPPPPPPPPPRQLAGEWLDWQLTMAAAAISPLRTRAAAQPAKPTALGTQAVRYAIVHPGTQTAEPLDEEAARSPALAQQAAARAGLRVLETYELQR